MENVVKNKQLHLVMLGQDAALLDESSEAAHRTSLYAKSFVGINAYVFAKKISKKSTTYNNVFVFGFSNIRESLHTLFKIYKDIREIKKKGVDTIISTQDPFEIGLLGLIISRVARIPLHVQVHTDISSPYMQRESLRSRIQYFLCRIVLPRANRIRVVSRRLVNFSIQQLGIKDEKIDYVPMLYVRDLKKTQYVFSEDCQIIVLPARFVWFKRIPLALDAFSIALQKNKNLYLKIIGTGPMKNIIEKTIQKYKISERVEIVSWMNAEELYKDASLTLISSIYEGWCRVAVESIEAGVPVVMTNVGCAHDFIQNNKQGIIVPIEQADALADAIQKILSNKNTYLEFKNRCLQTTELIDPFDIYRSKVVASWETTVSQS